MELDGFCHVRRTIRARCIPQNFQKVSPLQRLMRSTLLLASFQLAFTGLLAAVPFIVSATPAPSRPFPRAQPSIVQISGQFAFFGCFTDTPDDANLRDLATEVTVAGGPSSNSVENCITACKGFDRAGVAQGTRCFCDNGDRLRNGTLILDTGGPCTTFACPGNSAESCGGTNSILVYAPNSNSVP